MKAHAWFNAIGGFTVGGMALAACDVAVCTHEWLELAAFLAVFICMLRGAIRSACWLIDN